MSVKNMETTFSKNPQMWKETLPSKLIHHSMIDFVNFLILQEVNSGVITFIAKLGTLT